MRRLIQLLLLVFFVTASATGVRASTDCERWFATYKQELAHNKSVQRIEAARRRARMYARHKLAGYVRPAPENRPHPHHRPMSRKETLEHFELACGVLPEESRDHPLIAEETPIDFTPARPLYRGLGLIPTEDVGQLPLNGIPPYRGYADGGNGPSGDGPPMYYPTLGSAGGGGRNESSPPGAPVPPTSPPGSPGTFSSPPTPPVVPEPSSYVLMLTGLAGAIGVVRRRFNR